jgi:hypothetical protein
MDIYTDFDQNTVNIPKPKESVAEWPVIGPKVYAAWTGAAENLPGYVKENKAALESLVKGILSASATTMTSVLLLLGALIIAGIMVAFGEPSSAAMGCIVSRFTSQGKGPRLLSLSTLTV